MNYVYGLFKPSLSLELALINLKEQGFIGEKLMVVILKPCPSGKQTLLDSMFTTDGTSLVDGVALSATIGMVFGVIYGSQAHIGPIALGLIGTGLGGATGYLLDKLIKKREPTGNTTPVGEIILAVLYAGEEEAIQAEEIMQIYKASAIGRGPCIFKEN